MLSDRLTLAQKKRFGASSEKYAEGYTQLGLFNEAEQEADPDVQTATFRGQQGRISRPVKAILSGRL